MKWLRVFFSGILLLIVSGVADAEDVLTNIRESGRLVVGVKVNYPPWAMLNQEGENVGFEPDLAARIAAEISREKQVKVVFKIVTSVNRFRKLNDGEVDILIATVGDTYQRRQQVNMVHPHYFESGVRVLMLKKREIKQWSDLIDRPVCLTAGAYFNKELVKDYRINPIIMMNNRDAQLALLTNKCVAWAYDSDILFDLSGQSKWKEYELGLETILPVYWSIVTRKGADSASLSLWLSGYIQSQIRNGDLVTLADKWKLPKLAFLEKQQTAWQQKNEQGDLLCQVNQTGSAKKQMCFTEPLRFSVVEQSEIWPLDHFDTQRLIKSLLHTVFFTLAAMILAQGLAITFSYLTMKNPWGLGRITSLFTAINSYIPPILMLYLVYFGALPLWLHSNQTYLFNGMMVALLVLALYTAAGINNLVTLGQLRQTTLLVLYLQHQVGVRANLVNLVKAAGIASVLASPNAVLVINSLVSSYGYPIFLMSLLTLFYYFEVMFFTIFINYILKYLERRAASIADEPLLLIKGKSDAC